jgi:hypothetical protein
MLLQIKARHFKDTNYCIGLCAIDKAILDIVPKGTKVVELVTRVAVNGRELEHACYGVSDFRDDKDVAIAAGYDDTVIREIAIPGLERFIQL